MKKRKLYVAYGCNLDIFTMSEICPSAVIVGACELIDYRLTFRGSTDNAFLTIEPAENESVPGLVWELNEEDIGALDRSLGFSLLYKKIMMDLIMYPNVETMYGSKQSEISIEAIVYVMKPGCELNMPSADYLNIVLDVYDEAGFDPTAIENAFEMSQIHVFKNNPIIDPATGFNKNA